MCIMHSFSVFIISLLLFAYSRVSRFLHIMSCLHEVKAVLQASFWFCLRAENQSTSKVIAINANSVFDLSKNCPVL